MCARTLPLAEAPTIASTCGTIGKAFRLTSKPSIYRNLLLYVLTRNTKTTLGGSHLNSIGMYCLFPLLMSKENASTKLTWYAQQVDR